MERARETIGSVICKRVLIQAQPSVVYQALTDARELTRWFCDRCSSDARVGGELVASWKSGEQGRAVFTRMVPDAEVEIEWIDDGRLPAGAATQTTSYTILARRGTSEVTMRDADRGSRDQATLALFGEGWNSVLWDLKDYCERKQRSSRRKIQSNAVEPSS
jgi:uncharacterized protein YndB with AHSA1/START domain